VASRRVKLGPSALLDPAIGNYFAAELGCEVTSRMDQERKNLWSVLLLVQR
jgi:hypothetical protein